MPPQLLEFSKDMSYEQLAVWLTNHPQLVGADYQQDISKLRGKQCYKQQYEWHRYYRYSL